MNENEIHELIKSGENRTLLLNYFAQQPEHLNILLKIAFDDSEKYTWRAAWMADKIHEQNPELILPFLPLMTEFVVKTQHSGKKRHLLKLISLHDIQEENLALFLNYCIEIFMNAAEPVAVRVHAMQILFNIALKEPDFSGELIEMIEHELEYHGSAGMTSRGKKLLVKLHNLKKGRQ